ncbi:ATP-binding protein [Candidatus Nomurabacteria bacterium]|nr:ATP-binding protein [Candidatus Nomurabacteria bacterium]
MNIPRTNKKLIQDELFKGRLVIIFGARRTGKTTLSKEILKNYPDIKSKYLSCDEPDVVHNLSNKTSTELRNYLGDNKLVVIDEAQRVENIGITLKLVVDNYPEIQIIATGSSSFELANKIIEPLTGRHVDFFMGPISLNEASFIYDNIELRRLSESFIIYGMYPEIVTCNDSKEKGIILKRIVNDYLFKDLFVYDGIHNTKLLQDLTRMLALNVGNTISYDYLAKKLDSSRATIIKYIDLLEKAFVIFKATPFYTNKAKEITKQSKIYFYDTGIRNALLNNFDPLELRTDSGAIFENFVFAEFAKLEHPSFLNNPQFWRTTDKSEVDYIKANADTTQIYALEIKISKTKSPTKAPLAFRNIYPDAKFESINKDNMIEYFTKK